jgi:hypothetical protein
LLKKREGGRTEGARGLAARGGGRRPCRSVIDGPHSLCLIVFPTLEGELLLSLDRVQFGQGFRWGQCMFEKMQQSNLPLGCCQCCTVASFFLFDCYSLLQKKAGVIAANDGLAGGLLQGGMLLLVSRWLLIDVLQLRTLSISRTHG